MKRFLLASLMGMLIANLAFGVDIKSQIGTQDLAVDTDGTAHGTFTRRTSTGGTITLDKIDGNQIPWSNSYSRTIRPGSITGNSTGRIQGFSFGSSSYTDNGYFGAVYDNNVVNVKDPRYGADNTGVADSTAAFAAAAAAVPPYGTVFVPPGTYSVTGIVISPSNPYNLRGVGRASKISVTGANYGVTVGADINTEMRDVTVENLWITGTSSGKGGVRLGASVSVVQAGIVNISLRNLYIDGFTSNSVAHTVITGGAVINGGAGIFIGYGVNIIIDMCYLRNNYYGLLENSFGNATVGTITNTYFKSNIKYGEYLTSTRHFTHINSAWETNGESGLYAVTPSTEQESNLDLSVYGGTTEQNLVTGGTYEFVVGNDNANDVRNLTINGLSSSLSAAAIATGKKHLLMDRGREASIYNLYVGDATQTPITTTNSTSVWIFGVRDDAAASVLDSKTLYIPFDVSDGSIFGIRGKLRVGTGGSAISKHLTGTAALDFDLSGSSVYQDKTITVSGFAMSDGPVCSGVTAPVSGAVTDNMVFTCFPTADNVVTVRGMRTGGTPNPGSGTFRVDVWVH